MSENVLEKKEYGQDKGDNSDGDIKRLRRL